MTIRFECDQCGSVLKIKDELAGKPGKCPKCKTAFTVPNLPEESAEAHDEDSAEPAERPERQSRTTQNETDSGDFDVDAFLSNDDEPPKKPKALKSKSPPADLDDDHFLSDEPVEKGKGKKPKGTTSSTDEEDEVFRIRRGDAEVPSPKKAVASGSDEEEVNAAPSRRTPGTNPAGTASNFASDLLSKSGKKGKKTAWNEAEPEKKNESDFDWDGFKTFLFKDALPKAGGGIALILVLYFGAAYLMGGKSNLPALGQVTGKVTLGDAPLAGVGVWFHPIKPKTDDAAPTTENTDKKKPNSVSSSFGKTNDAGMYELSYLENIKGAGVGECRIEIDAPGRVDIPVKYVGSKSKITKQVKPGSQVIDLNLSE